MNKIPLIKYEQLPYREYNNGINCRYSIKIGQFYYLNQDGSRTKGNVYLKDNKTNIVYKRVGDGRQIGNFHPIFINFMGEKIQIEKLLWIE